MNCKCWTRLPEKDQRSIDNGLFGYFGCRRVGERRLLFSDNPLSFSTTRKTEFLREDHFGQVQIQFIFHFPAIPGKTAGVQL